MPTRIVLDDAPVSPRLDRRRPYNAGTFLPESSCGENNNSSTQDGGKSPTSSNPHDPWPSSSAAAASSSSPPMRGTRASWRTVSRVPETNTAAAGATTTTTTQRRASHVVGFRSSILRELAVRSDDTVREEGRFTSDDIRASPRFVGYIFSMIAASVHLVSVVK